MKGILSGVLLGCYIVVFALVVGGLIVWRSKRGGSRPPLPFLLLRSPGESLRLRVQRFDQNLAFMLPLIALTPLAMMFGMLKIWIWLAPNTRPIVGVSAAILVGFTSSAITGYWFYKKVVRYRSDMLGYLGERVVGEYLQSLDREYRVFHDIPAVGRNKSFNLDHVAVGPSGVSVIETKTRRKGRALPGRQDHAVAYDGIRLIWPWGEDSYGLDQLRAETEWLYDLILKKTGIDAAMKSILVLPGWYVNGSFDWPIKVMNEKVVAKAVSYGASTLSANQILMIAGVLEAMCRDVRD